MTHRNKKSNILYLTGITIQEIKNMQDIYNRRLEEIESMEEVDTTVKFDEIPKKYTGYETWRKHTNLKCWTCGMLFDSIPYFVPLNPKFADDNDNSNKKLIIEADVVGNFCSLPCAVFEIRTFFKKHMEWSLINSIRRLHKDFTGVMPPIPQSGLRAARHISYGGDLDNEEFIKHTKSL